MTALNLLQLKKMYQDPLDQGIIENVIVQDELLAQLPMVDNGTSLVKLYDREKALPAASWVLRGGSISEDNSFAIDQVTTYLRTCVVQQALDRTDGGSNYGLLRAQAIAKAVKAVSQSVSSKLLLGDTALTATMSGGDPTLITNTVTGITVGPNHDTSNPIGALKYTHVGTVFAYKAPGDATWGAGVICAPSATTRVYSDSPDKWIEVTRNANAIGANDAVIVTLSGGAGEFDGMFKLTPASQTLYAGTNGGNLSFELLDELESLVTDPNGVKVYVMGKRTFNAFSSLERTAGGVTMAELGGARVPMYRGVPILRTSVMPVNRTRGTASTCSSVFCVTLGEGAGLAGLMAKPADGAVGNELIAQVGPVEVVDLGISATKNERMVRCTALVGLMNQCQKGIALLDGILD